MIPKIIHFCWLSDDVYPDTIKKCMLSWENKLKGYTFIHWDKKRFDIEENVWVKQAYENKKYAFAADYIRLYAVYNYGGIYLDTDVEVLKNFDDLLSLPYFIGSEGLGIVEAAVIGAEPKMSWIKECLDYYNGKSFVKLNGELDTWTLPRIMMSQIEKKRNVIEIPSLETQYLPSYQDSTKVVMLPRDYFCAKNHGTGVIEKTINTYSIHHFAMSWVSKQETFLADTKRSLIKIFGVKFILGIINFFKLKKLKKIFKR